MTIGRANFERPHVFVLPEDRANAEVVNGFLKHPSVPSRTIQVLNPADGWIKVLEDFESREIAKMRQYPKRFMVLLIDFDGHLERTSYARSKVPVDLVDKVFILGSLMTPENLQSAGLGKREEIGFALAEDCRKDTNEVWGHDLLRHNAGELARLREYVRPILFS
jgi:hypothetical protein